MLNKCRKRYGGVITLHKPLPLHLRHHTCPRNVGQKLPLSSAASSSSSSEDEEECLYVTSVTQKSGRVVTRPGSEADKAHTLFPFSVKHHQDQFLSERREADAVAQPLLDAENGFIKDLEGFLNRSDMLSLKRRELLHKRWTECVWRLVQRNVKASTSPLKDPLFLYSRSRLEETRVILHCQTGRADGYQLMEQSRGVRRGSRNPGPVYMTVDDGRCFRPECWSAIGL